MRKVFADTLYWLAIVKPSDPYKAAAMEARHAVGQCIIVTTDEVLYEFANALARGGANLRGKAVRFVRNLFSDPNVKVVTQSRETFLRALERFENRPDKAYSLTDCSSMNAMDAEGIKDVFGNDHHFQQEGYNVLIRPSRGTKPR
jgi:uncharacterized protein